LTSQIVQSTGDRFPTSRRGWYAVIVLAAAVLLSFTDRLIINLLVEDIRLDLGISYVEISLLQGLGFGIIYALCALPLGRLADSINRRNLVMAAIAIWSLGTAACGLVQNFQGFFVARMIVGLGEAALIPAANSIISDCFPPQRRGAALGLFAIGALLGAGVGIMFGGWLLAAIRGGMFSRSSLFGALPPWRIVLILAAAPAVPLLLAMAFITEPVRKDRAGPLRLAAMLQHLGAQQATIPRICLAVGLVAAGDYGLLSWYPTFLQRAHGISANASAVLVGLAVSIAGVGASVSAGLISDRLVRRGGLSARPSVMLGAYVLCVVAALLLNSGTTFVLVSGLFLWVFGSVAGNIVGIAVLQESVPNELRATTVALCNLCSAIIGLSFGPSSVALAARWLFEDAHALGPGIAAVTLIAALAGLAMIGTLGLRSLRSIDDAKLAR